MGWESDILRRNGICKDVVYGCFRKIELFDVFSIGGMEMALENVYII